MGGDRVLWLLLALGLGGVGVVGSTARSAAPRLRAVVALLLVGAAGTGAVLYPSLSPKAGLLLGNDSACHQHTLQLQRALKNRTLWAARMTDASARLVVGGLWGARFQLGSFDGCLSAGAASPVGARYCLAALSQEPPQDSVAASPPLAHNRPYRQRPHTHQTFACEDFPVDVWDHVSSLDPNLDAQVALQGCGLAPGSVPLTDVLVALCVPASCDAASLQAALQASLGRSPAGTRLQVRVDELHCVDHAELASPRPLPVPAALFWTLVLVLSAAVVAAPYLGWSAWNWRTHLRALSLPEAPLADLDLNVVSGIRAVNMVLLVGAHRAFNTARLPTSNQMIYTAESRTSPWHAIGHHAALLVDSCFFMSGLLMSLSMTPGRRQEPLRVLANRYLRLTPSYALVMVFYATAMESVGSGPLWKATTVPEAAACRRWWWANLLYVNNYFHGELGELGCMLQTWSLAVDVQQLVLGTLLLPLALAHMSGRRGRAGDWPVLAAGMVAVALPFVATLVHGWPPMLVWSGRALQNPYADPMFYGMYAVTHMRAAPYIVGVVTGCAMLRIKEQTTVLDSATASWLTWGGLSAMAAVMVSSVAFGDLTQPPRTALEAALYASLSPCAWAAALGALVVGLTLGPHSAVAGLLRWQPLVTLSRLSYGVFLVHFAVQLLQGAAARSPLYVTVGSVVVNAFSDMVISLIVSLWLYVAVEAPVRQLAKMLLSEKKLDVKTVT